jgi:predicted nucleic acid-binding protein
MERMPGIRTKLLVDTGALLALAMRRDQHHRAAVAFLKSVPQARFVMSSLVLAEVATRLRARGGAAKAVSLVRAFLNSRRYEVVFVDRALLDAALDKMERYRDKQLSLPDCASFALMDTLGLDTAFAFDMDFRDCGYRVVPARSSD